MKDNNLNLNSMDPSTDNPYQLILHKLTGVPLQRPRQRSAVNTWRKTQRDSIELEVKTQTKKVGGVHRDKLAAFRDKIAKNMFSKLSKEEQTRWEEQAKEEQKERLAKWKHELESPPSAEPAARQRYFEALPGFAQLFLDAICDAIGCKATLLVGGPEPAHGGRLKVLSVHSGTMPGDIKINFGRLERARIDKYIIPIFGSFLQACYTPEECRARALPTGGEHSPLDAAELQQKGFDFHTLDGANITNLTDAVPPTLTSASVSQLEPHPSENPPAHGPDPSGGSPPPSTRHSPPYEDYLPSMTRLFSPAPSVRSSPPLPAPLFQPSPPPSPTPSPVPAPENGSLPPSLVPSSRPSPGPESGTSTNPVDCDAFPDDQDAAQLGKKRKSDSGSITATQAKRPRAAAHKDYSNAPAKQDPDDGAVANPPVKRRHTVNVSQTHPIAGSLVADIPTIQVSWTSDQTFISSINIQLSRHTSDSAVQWDDEPLSDHKLGVDSKIKREE